MSDSIRFIGKVSSPLKKLDDCPRQETENAPEAKLILSPEYSIALKDIKPGDQLLVFTWFHLADRNILQCHPRNDNSITLTGVFSTRSPDRPNPIGLHSVRVISIKSGEIVVNHLEALDQTPIIDIKPVL